MQAFATIDEAKREIFSSLMAYIRIFYLIRTGREFTISEPIGRESHLITICKALTRVIIGECPRLIINVPPRYGKTELIMSFISWAFAQYPDSQFIYVSCTRSLATKSSQTIRSTMLLSHYKKLFGVSLSDTTTQKFDFDTNFGGCMYAVGAGGTIVGRGAGIQGCNRFGGCIVIDDIHKPDEAASDTIREGVIDWYYNTLISRLNSSRTPIIFIGQRVHERDLAAHLIDSGDFEVISLPAIDAAGNALYPELHDLSYLRKLQEFDPYVFSAQFQQNPQPSGGGIFKPEWFYLTDDDPEGIFATFITVDTAASEKDYADYTVFSFWGVHRTEATGDLALHWINCVQLKCDPADLEGIFMEFFIDCTRYRIKPSACAIENASTAVTLIACLKRIQGFNVIPINRQGDKKFGDDGKTVPKSKIDRFLSIQNVVARQLISINRYAKHTDLCLEHCRKITANNSHAHDDIADTLYDAIKVGIFDQRLSINQKSHDEKTKLIKTLAAKHTQLHAHKRYGHGLQ